MQLTDLRLALVQVPLARTRALIVAVAALGAVGPFVALASLVASLVAAALPASASAQEIFEVVEIAEGIYGSFVREPHSPSQYAASLIAVNDDHVIVVDSRHTPSAARALIDEIRAISNRPVRYVVNTHWHSDHVYGNEAFTQAYPDVEIVGHPATVGAMQTVGAQRLADEIQSTQEQIETWLRWLEAGETDEGQALSAEDSVEVQSAVELALDHEVQLERMGLVVPTLLVSDTLLIESGDRTIRIFHPGPAHTAGDLVVEVLPESVLAVGDLIEDGFPYLDDGTVTGTAQALMRLASVPAEVVFGAHARLLADRSLLDMQTRFFEELVAEVDRAIAGGDSVDKAVEDVRMPNFREPFTAGIASREERYDAWIEGLVRQAYAERRAER